MSYILEALKRADQERSRGATPDIHTQPVLPASGSSGDARRTPPWVWIAAGLAIGAGAVAAWRWMAGPETATPPSPARVAVSAGVVTPTAAPAAADPSGPVATTTAAPGPSPTAPTPAASSPAAATARAIPASPAPARPSPAASQVRPGVVAPPITKPTAPAPPAAPSSAVPVVAWQDLPEDTRRRLPALKLGGSIYSARPADRLLMVDGQVAREGDTIAPGVVLERIGPRTAVLRAGALRYEVRL